MSVCISKWFSIQILNWMVELCTDSTEYAVPWIGSDAWGRLGDIWRNSLYARQGAWCCLGRGTHPVTAQRAFCISFRDHFQCTTVFRMDHASASPAVSACHVVYTDYRPTPLQHFIFVAGGQGIHMVVDETVSLYDQLIVRHKNR